MLTGSQRFAARLALAVFVFSWSTDAAISREPVTIKSDADRLILQNFVKHAEDCVDRVRPDAVAKIEEPEDICWVWSHYARMPLAAYRLTGERRHLDGFVKVMDSLLTRLRKGPDGYLGFRGLPLSLFRDKDNPHVEIDVDIAEFEIAHLACDFAEVVTAEESLRTDYRDAMARFLDVAEKQLAGDKWESRKLYMDLGPQGAVFRMPAECGNNRNSLTNPHNKQSKMCRAYLALYRVVGKDEYFRKAVKLGIRFKHTLRMDGDRYLWNYWDPAGPWDRKGDESQPWKHWIGPEHRSGYHGLTLAMVEALYDHGVVFDKVDLQRFVNTQMTICWDGSCDKPVFRNTGGKLMGQTAMIAPALARFEPRIGEFCYGTRATNQRLQRPEHSWQGGVLAVDYLCGKYLAVRSPEETQSKKREQFCRKPENAAFLDSLQFQIGPPKP